MLPPSSNGGNNGQITSVTDNVDAVRTLTFAYDALGRLVFDILASIAEFEREAILALRVSARVGGGEHSRRGV